MKPTVLVLTSHYIPGYRGGGPIRSVSNLVSHFGNELDIKIITRNRDLGCSKPYENVPTGKWIDVGLAKVLYLSPEDEKAWKFLKLLSDLKFDALYVNSFFCASFSILPIVSVKLGVIAKRPILLAPRGEFSLGAFQIKWFKKQFFVVLSKIFRVYSTVVWHASTEHELVDVVRVMNVQKTKVYVARNLGAIGGNVVNTIVSKDNCSLKVCFVSRVSKKKNLDFALNVLRRVVSRVNFSIYGPLEDLGYWRECEEIIGTLPAHIKVDYKGEVPNDKVQDVLAEHDLFFFPSRGENFGHAMVEAWVAGLPVLTSDQTPWRRLREKGVGWDISLDREIEFAQVLDQVANYDHQSYLTMRRKSSEFGTSILYDSSAVDDNRKMFNQLLKTNKLTNQRGRVA